MMPAAIGGAVIFLAWMLSRRVRKTSKQFVEIDK